MKIQVCDFQRTEINEPERGIAIVINFNYHNSLEVIDENGQKIVNPYSVNLRTGPLAFIDTLDENSQLAEIYR